MNNPALVETSKQSMGGFEGPKSSKRFDIWTIFGSNPNTMGTANTCPSEGQKSLNPKINTKSLGHGRSKTHSERAFQKFKTKLSAPPKDEITTLLLDRIKNLNSKVLLNDEAIQSRHLDLHRDQDKGGLPELGALLRGNHKGLLQETA